MNKILAIDDQEDNLITINGFLKIFLPDCKLYLAQSGKEGLLMAQKVQPDTILLDILMPEMDGFEVCEKLKEDERTKYIPIIMLSALGENQESRVKGLNLGADAFVSKPFIPTELQAQINVMLRIKEAEDLLRQEKLDLSIAVQEKTKILNRTNEELKQEIKERKHTENRLRQILENSKEWIWEVDKNGLYTYSSDLSEDLIGYKPKDLINKKYFYDFFHPSVKNQVKVKVLDAFKNKQTFKDLVNWNITKEGKNIWLSSSGVPILDKDNNLVGYRGADIDITAKYQAELALRDIATQFASLSGEEFFEQVCRHLTKTLNVDYAYIGELSEDKQRIVIKSGFGQEKPLEKFTYPVKDTPCEKVILKGACTYTKGVQSLFPKDHLLHKMKIEGYIGIPLFNRSHELLGIVILLDEKEITNKLVAKSVIQIFSDRIASEMERLKAELALQESERRISTLINNLKGIAYRCSNNKDWTMEFVSAGVEDITGYKAEDIINDKKLSFNNLIIPEDRDRVWSEIQSAIKKKESFEIHYQIKTLSGETRHMSEKGSGIFDETSGKLLALEGFINDITVQVLANKTLKASEEQNRSITQTAADAIISINHDGIILSWNKAAEKIFGYTSEEMIGNSLSSIIPEHYYHKHYEGIKRIKDGGERKLIGDTIEIEAINKDGLLFPIELSLSSWDVEDQKYFTGIIRDITTRKAAEKTLLKLSAAVEQSPSVITITDLDGNIEYINPKFTELLGYSGSEVLGKNPRILKSGEKKREHYKQMWETITSGNVWRGEFYNRKKNGEYYWEDASISPIFDSNNVITNYIKIAEDITNRKRSEQLQKVLFHISNAVITTDNLGKLIDIIREELSVVIDTTNFFIALYDKEKDSISLPFQIDEKLESTSFPAGKTLTKYVVSTGKSLLATKNRLLELEQLGVVDRVGPDSEVWLGVPLKLEDEIMGVLAVQSYTNENAYDETDMELLEFVSDQISISIHRKKTENDLYEALNKATESDRLKSAFLATISHELRTPLNAIIGFSDLINEEWPMSEIVGFAKTINESGTHLLKIVEEIFNITLIETGETILETKKEKLHSILNEINVAIKLEQLKLKKNKIKVQQIIHEDDRNLLITTDVAKLKQILLNLLKNALKFTHEGYIKYGYDFIEQQEIKMLRFYVEDTGIGISKDKQGLIFETFRQVEESLMRNYGGLGIGLSIAKKLTELLGGKIWLESTEGKGSTFYFTIPVDSSEINDGQFKIQFSDKKEGQEEDDNSTKRTYLIVEDDETSFEFLEIVLNKPGVKILWAKNGKEAIDFCKNIPDISLVLMDINMRVMDGYQATMEIKRNRPDLPIIAQTANAIAGSREKTIKAGCDDYISKPIKVDELLKKIEKFF